MPWTPSARGDRQLLRQPAHANATSRSRPSAIDADDGRLDLDDLRAQLGDEVAAVYFENPNFLGVIEDQVGRSGGGGQARSAPR